MKEDLLYSLFHMGKTIILFYLLKWLLKPGTEFYLLQISLYLTILVVDAGIYIFLELIDKEYLLDDFAVYDIAVYISITASLLFHGTSSRNAIVIGSIFYILILEAISLIIKKAVDSEASVFLLVASSIIMTGIMSFL